MADKTYANMQSKIADDISRTDLTTQIQEAILDAIRDHERRRFWFNEARDTSVCNCVVGQEFYSSSDAAEIGTMPHLDRVSILSGGLRYTLREMTPQEMEDISVSPTATGTPSAYSYYNKQIRLYPIPDYAYPIYLSGTVRYTLPSADADVGVWMNEAEQLIRATAKKKIFRDILRDTEQAGAMAQAEREALDFLNAETAWRGGPMRIRATQF